MNGDLLGGISLFFSQFWAHDTNFVDIRVISWPVGAGMVKEVWAK